MQVVDFLFLLAKLTVLPFVTGIHNVEVVIPQDLVIVDTVLKTGEVQALLESTGLLVFFKGFGSTLNLAAGV